MVGPDITAWGPGGGWSSLPCMVSVLSSTLDGGIVLLVYGESCMIMSMGSSTSSSTMWLILGRVFTLHSYFPLSNVVEVLMSSVQSSAWILGLDKNYKSLYERLKVRNKMFLKSVHHL